MDRIYRYNPNAFYNPNEGRYLQLMSAKDLYIQNITVTGYDSHSNSNFQTFYRLSTWCSES